MTGHNSIKMADLSNLYKDLKFNDVETYIQSGNVIFNLNDNIPVSDLSDKIEKEILKRFSYIVPVMIRTVEEMQEVFSSNPFLKEKHFESSKMAVVFLHKKLEEEQIQRVININYPPDKFKIIGNEIFIYCPNGFGETKLYTNFFEKKMGVTGTARNWKTITNMLQLAEKR